MTVPTRLPVFQSIAYREVGIHAIPDRFDTMEMAKNLSDHTSQDGQAWSEDQNLSEGNRVRQKTLSPGWPSRWSSYTKPE